jgi:outer membrane immunogenic protein
LASFASRISSSALLAAAAVAATGAASAADLTPNFYGGTPSYFALTWPSTWPNTWTGPYVGATLGYEWGSVDNNPTRPNGVAGGFEAGFNWQNGNLVYGGEADINLSAAEDTFAPWQFSNPWFGTARGRAGVAINNVLIFGTAGLAYGKLTGITFGNPSESHASFGWTAGIGTEVSFTQHWSAKAEWLYLDLADHQFSVTAANNGLAANLLRLGLNYHF